MLPRTCFYTEVRGVFLFLEEKWYTLQGMRRIIFLNTLMMERIVMYSDGGSRGNPGPSALGVFLETLRIRYGEFLGRGTNNEAEYAAILSGMRRALAEIGAERAKKTHLECRMDSELAMKQLTGRYRVKHPRMKHWFDLIQNEKANFAEVSFHHVPREKNKEADKMVNEALDLAGRRE
jgi:ribonuclease HI